MQELNIFSFFAHAVFGFLLILCVLISLSMSLLSRIAFLTVFRSSPVTCPSATTKAAVAHRSDE